MRTTMHTSVCKKGGCVLVLCALKDVVRTIVRMKGGNLRGKVLCALDCVCVHALYAMCTAMRDGEMAVRTDISGESECVDTWHHFKERGIYISVE